MNTLYILTAIILLVTFIAVSLKNKQNKIKEELPELWKKQIMTGAELTFYKELINLLPKGYVVSCKCKIDDLIGCKRSENAFRNRIKSRHFDFTVLDVEKNEIVSVIELDDKTHEKEKQQVIDKFKNDICRKANLKLVRFKANRKLHINDIEILI